MMTPCSHHSRRSWRTCAGGPADGAGAASAHRSSGAHPPALLQCCPPPHSQRVPSAAIIGHFTRRRAKLEVVLPAKRAELCISLPQVAFVASGVAIAEQLIQQHTAARLTLPRHTKACFQWQGSTFHKCITHGPHDTCLHQPVQAMHIEWPGLISARQTKACAC